MFCPGMEKNKFIRDFTYVILLMLFFSISGYSTHIKAGEFSAKRLSDTSLTYEITLTLYYNTVPPAVDPPSVVIEFGDGSSQTVNRRIKTDVGNNTTKNVFIIDSYTYRGASTYVIRMRDQNRNKSIQNIPGSDNVAFYVEMQLQVNPLYGLNNSPIMTVPPIDFGAVGKIFTHNPGAYDPDGDSLSYELIPAQSGYKTPVAGYNYPGSPIFGGQSTLGGPAFLTLDPSTGDLLWNAPSNYGTPPRYYNIAMKITEWRFGRKIGYIVRDMQVEILETVNNPPKLSMPKDTCIEAGKFLQALVSAKDIDNDAVLLETYGQPYAVTSPATFSIVNQSTANPSGTFKWQTSCAHVRKQPYQVVFKATDEFRTPVLVDIQSWLIYVKGPKVKGITTTPGFNSITLNWPLYTCSNQAEKINIYRMDCDSVAPSTDPCKTGPLAGYTLIGSVPATQTSFVDNDKGAGLDKGKSYCYMLVAEYPSPAYGESIPSDQVCASLAMDIPVMNSIDVTETSTTTGKISLTWYAPSSGSVTAPFIYELERGEGENPTSFTTIATFTDVTSYTDNNLDTKNIIYSYRLKLLNNAKETAWISTFDLSATAGNATATLKWKYTQPWIIDSVQVYRKVNTNPFVKLATLNDSDVSYTDKAVQNCDTVYYYVKQFGHYCDKLLTDVATATSAIDSVVPTDDRLLDPPVLTVNGCNGDLTVFQDVLNWTDLMAATCNTFDHYNVYFSKHESDNISLLLQTTATTYTYVNHQTTAGCFTVSATNTSGLEGPKGPRVCVDDCVFYELPNLLTVNNDGKNDLIQPFPIPRGASFVRYYVYNRWGGLVYYKDTDPNINWDGKTEKGALSDGIYYYLAEVHFYGRLKEEDEIKNLKGWLQILTTK